MHVVHLIANNSSVPYFNWFAERIGKYPDMKFSFVALYPDKPTLIEELRNRGCDAYWVRFDHRQRKAGMITSFFRLFRLFRMLKPDAIHTHLFDDSLPALLAARLARVKIRVILKQDTAFHWNFKPIWVWADRFNNINATHIVATSGESKKFILENEKARASKVYMVHHGIDLKAIKMQDENLKNKLKEQFNPRKGFLILTIARYIEWKGYRYIIEAAKTIIALNKNIKFLFAGYGEQEQELQQLISTHGLNDYIQLTGWVDRNYIPSLFGIANIYLHAAVMEPFGFVIAEAMANGVPIVSTKTGVAADLLTHKETCYFVESRNGSSIAEGIAWMIEHLKEREEMKGKLETMAIESLGVDLMLEKYLKLYKGQLTNN